MTHQIYYILVILVCIYLGYKIYDSNTSKKEDFIIPQSPTMSHLKSFVNNHRSTTDGYICDIKTDNTVATFENVLCNKYVDPQNLGKFDTYFTTVVINAGSFEKKFTTDDIRVFKRFTGELKKYNSKSLTGKPYRTQNISKDEALSLCEKDYNCEHVVVGKFNYKNRGKAFFFKNSIESNPKYDYTTELHSKVYNYEYSIAFWFKIDKISYNNSNIIFQHGTSAKSMYPKISIKPYSTRITFTILTTEGIESNIDITGIPLKKWAHIIYVLKNKTVRGYLDGKQVVIIDLNGQPKMPIKENIRLAEGSGYKLSKFAWTPIALSQMMVDNLAFSTYPTDIFDPELNLNVDLIPASIKFKNNWRETIKVLDDQESSTANEWHEVKVVLTNNIVFIDGFISGPPMTNTKVEIGTIPTRFCPKSTKYFPLHLKGGFITMSIQSNGLIEIHRNRDYKYIKHTPISLSNIRYSILNSTSDVSLGNIIFNTNNQINLSNKTQSKIYKLCNNCMPRDPYRTLRNLIIAKDNRTGKMFSKTLIRNQSGDKAIYKGLYKNTTIISTNSVASLSLGKPVKILSGWYKDTSHNDHSGITVTLYDNVVKLSGTIKKYFFSPKITTVRDKDEYKSTDNDWNSQLIGTKGCYKETPYENNNDLSYRHRASDSGYNELTCAKDAFDKGHKYIGINTEGKCRSGSSYGKKGTSNNCDVCEYDNSRPCGGTRSNIIYEASIQPELIGKLNKKYAPDKSLKFLCASGDGTAQINIMDNGEIYWVSTDIMDNDSKKEPWVSLDDIVYLVNPDNFIEECSGYLCKNYRGSQNKTISGRTCQKWDDQSPHGHSRTKSNYPNSGLESNLCRNPDNERTIWCYTTDRNKRWEVCKPKNSN